jgi:gas vesicle protein
MPRNNGESLVWFLIGAAAGASVALLYAPQSGDRTRRMLGRKLAEGREALEDQGSELLEKGRKVADDAAELFEKGRSMVKG